MGTIGTGINQDDTVSDIVGFITDRLKAGDSLHLASSKAKTHFAELESDTDEAPLFWLALASIQWKFGDVDPLILERVRYDITSEAGLDRWREDPKSYQKRKAVLAAFLSKIESKNQKPSALPKLIVRKAPFKKGDCLSFQLSDGNYTAALVLQENNDNPEYGTNLVASLDYYDTKPPELSFFKRRQWLILRHGNWNNEPDICWYLPVHFQQARKNITVIGNEGTKFLDPKDSPSHVGWRHLGVQILLCRKEQAR